MRTLLYEAANVMLTRYKGPLKLKLPPHFRPLGGDVYVEEDEQTGS